MPHPEREGWFTVTDTKWMMVCDFEAHRFNETQTYPDMGMLAKKDAQTVAHAMAELGDWLFSHHYADALPVPTFELKRSDDDADILVVRHKKPHVVVSVPANELNDLNSLASTLKKMAEFLTKRVAKYNEK